MTQATTPSTKSCHPSRQLCLMALQNLQQTQLESFTLQVAPAIQDFLIRDVIQWTKDDPETFRTEIFKELTNDKGDLKQVYYELGAYLVDQNHNYLGRTYLELGIILARTAATRVLLKKATEPRKS